MRTYFLLAILFITSCVYNKVAITEDLDGGFYYIGAARESSIIYRTSSIDRPLAGVTVVPEEVLKYNFNSIYIIAKSKESFSESLSYWIIDKSDYNNKFMTKDSTNFLKELVSLQIDLRLKKENSSQASQSLTEADFEG